VKRRQLLFALGTSPLWLAGCAHREETPLGYLYGRDWVHGAYELYAGKYASLQRSSEDTTQQAYAVLAQKGVTALDALQKREVPFLLKVDAPEASFKIVRDLPDRLTFTADMTEADRAATQARWEKAREHIQTDYEEIRRLNWALTTLLGQMQHIRSAIDAGRLEQFSLVRRLSTLSAGDKPPFDLPYEVSVDDYRDVLYLLIERLEDDGKRLARIESDIVTVGLTARATDAGSASLATNLHKVLLAVVTDAEGSSPRAPTFPALDTDRARFLGQGKELCASIQKTPEYVTWEKHERTKAFDQVGMLLQTLDAVTGLHASVIYQQALDIWRGDADYLSYLKTVVKMLPGGSHVVAVAEQAIALTEKARKIAGQVQAGVGVAQKAVAAGKRLPGELGKDPGSLLALANGSGLFNLGSDFARGKLGKQLAFFTSQHELDQVKGMVADSDLMKGALPVL
jgi:hypothetical protein